MCDKLNDLINKIIKRIELIHDYIQLYFTDGTILNIFNKFDVYNPRQSPLMGYRIDTVSQDEKYIILNLFPEGQIKIGLDASDFSGPEAMQYISNENQSVVWQ